MNAILSADRNWGIGYQNKLLISIPSDMKFFRQKTSGHVVVMGRKTLESFPGGLPLKNRVNIVLTRDAVSYTHLDVYKRQSGYSEWKCSSLSRRNTWRAVSLVPMRTTPP